MMVAEDAGSDFLNINKTKTTKTTKTTKFRLVLLIFIYFSLVLFIQFILGKCKSINFLIFLRVIKFIIKL